MSEETGKKRQEPAYRRYIQLAKMAKGEQVLWFLERIGLDRKFLGRVCRFNANAD